MRTTLTLTATEVLALHHATPNPSGPPWGVKTLRALPAVLPAPWGAYDSHFGRLVERKGSCFIPSRARLPLNSPLETLRGRQGGLPGLSTQ